MKKTIGTVLMIFSFSFALDFDSSGLPEKDINPERPKPKINYREIFKNEVLCGSLYEVSKEVSLRNKAKQMLLPHVDIGINIDGNMVFVNLYLPLTVRFLGDNGLSVRVNPNTYLADIYSPYGTHISFDLLHGKVIGSKGSPLFKVSSNDLAMLRNKGVKISYDTAGLFVKWLFENKFNVACSIPVNVNRKMPEKLIIEKIIFPIVKALDETDKTLIDMQRNTQIKKKTLNQFSDYLTRIGNR
jgi:hypothetical protein